MNRTKFLHDFRLFSLLFTIYIFFCYFRVSSAFDSFWAEDGQFYQEAVEEGLWTIFKPLSGYLVLIERLIGLFISPFTLKVAVFANFLLISIFTSIIFTKLSNDLSSFIDNNYLRGLLVVFIMMMPISMFDMVGTAVYLHFLLDLGLTIVLAKYLIHRNFTLFDSLYILLALLSGPLALAIFLFWVLFLLRLKLFQEMRHKLSLLITYFFAVIVQVWVIIQEQLNGKRNIESSYSILKTIYLYLERVIALNFVPFWSPINAREISNLADLGIRAAAAALVALLLLKLILTSYLASTPKVKNLILFLFSTSLFYWFISGFFVNPEPRYAIFPSSILYLLIFFTIANRLKMIGAQSKFRFLVLIPLLLIFSTILANGEASDMKKSGFSIEEQATKLGRACAEYGQETLLKVWIRPNGWFVELPCSKLG